MGCCAGVFKTEALKEMAENRGVMVEQVSGEMAVLHQRSRQSFIP